MAERRALVDGIKTPAVPVDPIHEEAFVYGDKKASRPSDAASTDDSQKPAAARKKPARVQLSTKMRADLAEALKDVSLDRQKERAERSTLQDILEEAVEPWLRSNGYLT
jgi:cell pole-organizing protein PopZ